MERIGDFFEPYIFFGDGGILIEGAARVIKWGTENICVSSGKKIIDIFGKNLRVEYKNGEAFLIKGSFEKIEFGRKRP